MTHPVHSTRESLIDYVDNLRVDQRRSVHDKDADVPFFARIDSSHVTLFVHPESTDSIVDTFSSVDREVALSAVTRISIIRSAVLLRMSSPKANVQELYELMSSGDNIYRQIQQAEFDDNLSEADSTFVLGALLDDEVTNDVARINGLRLFANLSLQDEKREKMRRAALDSLSSTLSVGRERYNQVARMFGMHCPYERSRYFSGSIQELVLGIAFPMDNQEADRALSLIP